VRRPWWLEWWALAAFVLLAAGALLAAHRIRVAMLLRLERQRTRIAMDLHDEMGSGLGSIGLLAGVAAGDRVDESTRRRIAAEIAEAAGDLGGALSDIVWSLREGADTLSALARRLAERGRRLFPNDAPGLTLVFPDPWPDVRLTLEVRRNLQLMVLEALHNAARHARACRVELGFAKESDAWCLWVADDGCGLPAAALEGRTDGHGVRNLRQRAAAIGARLAITGAPGAGTRITVHFDPSGRPVADAIARPDAGARSAGATNTGNGATNGAGVAASHHHANPPEPAELP
jgi:signal transduction histidine kinase